MIPFTIGTLVGAGCVVVWSEMYTRWLYNDVKRRAKRQGITDQQMRDALLWAATRILRLTLANRIINKEIEQVAIDLLKHHPRNANHGDVEAIKKSLAVNGWYGSVVANLSTKHILAGNHRVMAAKALGWETVPVQWVDVTP